MKISILSAIAFTLIFSASSCKKKDEPVPTPELFSFPGTSDLRIDLSWEVVGQTGGASHADLDLYVDDEETGANYSPDYRSTYTLSYEALVIRSYDANKTFNVGFVYYQRKTNTTSSTPYTINYTIKVYPPANSSAAKTYTGSLTATPDTQLVYDQLKLVKSASSYSFTELSPKTTFTIPSPALARIGSVK